ncbi:(6-4)DNA photolyase isoform X2 [Brachypodium distachyon]|uniref:(6-4)DNA photolyase isoform X2 n=1 Tax=Brachypodium distachyon TaxID=15368 RepID=UPI00071C94DD|nr:(6-4)DNA photolyase isoform X2 [Brachypodium distachyon]|eukprot:XP_014755728.1 (6-4)DNA photolyase isoform X2 [Brachypodium distachyon]
MDAATAVTATAGAAAAMVWFRKGLRVHDNPALDAARRGAARVYPVFVLDPRYLRPDPAAHSPGSARAGVARVRFLLESLSDLDAGLRRLGSRLLLLRARDDVPDALCAALRDWNIGKLCFEADTEPYALARDKRVTDFAAALGIEVFTPVSHTLFDPAEIIEKNGGRPPLTYQSFLAIAGEPPKPVMAEYSELPLIGDTGEYELLPVPKLEELGYGDISQENISPFRGGETEALKRMRESLQDKEWVSMFEKPKGDPSAFLKPATTVLSPYLKFGCLSSRYFYHCIQEVYRSTKKHTKPPVSLTGQLLWRDFFYTVSFGTLSFDHMKGNKICKQIPWRQNEELFVAWRDGRTGYPWIDAIMIQLRKWGWMHHLARHSVACFLTRGDLFIHWEKGRDVFERLLIDSDWAINNGNWLWLSCSSFFYQYHRIYSPISFGKKYDPNGDYIRHFIPVLKDMPKEYIYEPWTAPLSVQEKARCIVGRDYPKPVDHEAASKECRKRMGEAYASNRLGGNTVNGKTSESSRRKSSDGGQDASDLSKSKQPKRRS